MTMYRAIYEGKNVDWSKPVEELAREFNCGIKTVYRHRRRFYTRKPGKVRVHRRILRGALIGLVLNHAKHQLELAQCARRATEALERLYAEQAHNIIRTPQTV